MSGKKMLALDLGASSGRGIVGSFDGERLVTEEIHRFENSPVSLAGRFLWDIPALFGNILTAITKASSSGGVSSVGIDTWGVDYGYIDKNGHLLSCPVHYRDSRTENIREEVFGIIPWTELYGRTGIQDLAFNTIYQLRCDVRDDPHIIGAARRALFTPDLLNYFLTGVEATEYTIASTGAIIDAEKRSIAKDLLLRIGVSPELFAPCVQPFTVLGGLSAEVRGITGAGEDVKAVCTASHDTASAVLATPAKDPDFAYISCGTWSLLGVELPEPKITDETREYGFTNEGGAEGKIRFLKNISGLWLEQESRRAWGRRGRKYTYDELSEAALASKPFRYLIDPDDALFTPQGDMPSRIAEYCSRTGQGSPETPGEIVRCIFDSLALRYRWGVETVRKLTGKPVREIHVVGGGVREGALMRIAADVCGIPVVAGPSEATATGNICSQLIAGGELSSVSEARELVSRSTELSVYEPTAEGREERDDAYGRFLALTEQK